MPNIEGLIELTNDEEVEDFLRTLHDDTSGTYVLEPQDRWNYAIKAYHKPSNRLVYDGDKVIEIYQEDGMTANEAVEFADYNICFGPLTPLIHYDWHELEDLFDEGV